MKLKSCTAAAWSGTSRNHVKSFVFTSFYKGFGLMVTFSHNGNAHTLATVAASGIPRGGTSKSQGFPMFLKGTLVESGCGTKVRFAPATDLWSTLL